MATRRRNHFIPRFLLNRFASKRDGKKSWIWQLSQNGDAIEISTRDAAVATDFYGGPETGVEDAFAENETRFARTLAGIESGEPLSEHAESLRQFVWTLFIRTRALREHFTRTMKAFTDELVKAASSAEARDSLVRRVNNLDFLGAMEREISSLPEELRADVMASLATPQAREEVLAEAEAFMRSPLPQLFFGHLRDMLHEQGALNDAAEGGQIKGLVQLLEGSKAPDSFSPSYWQLYRVEAEPMILGDGCIVATAADGRFGSLMQSNNSWHTLYLPISRSTILVAAQVELGSLLQPKEINRASAELSMSHIYCSEVTESIRALVPLIGTRPLFLSEQEVSEIVASSWDKV